MWASAREELRRPGFKGGGGGRPFVLAAGLGNATRTVAAGGETTKAGFLPGRAGGFNLAEAAVTSTKFFTSGLATTLAATFGAGLATGFAAC